MNISFLLSALFLISLCNHEYIVKYFLISDKKINSRNEFFILNSYTNRQSRGYLFVCDYSSNYETGTQIPPYTHNIYELFTNVGDKTTTVKNLRRKDVTSAKSVIYISDNDLSVNTQIVNHCFIDNYAVSSNVVFIKNVSSPRQ
ncbi:MAG: hypothetical protein KDH96_08170 [Candidatus Riesia sp.]|nr:hypothetical protein [Candidatus Riesia sp.]